MIFQSFLNDGRILDLGGKNEIGEMANCDILPQSNFDSNQGFRLLFKNYSTLDLWVL